MQHIFKLSCALSFYILALYSSPGWTASAKLKTAVEVETGGVWTGMNDVRIPGDTGTLFSLKEDLETQATSFFRLKASHQFGKRHTISGLMAPLSIESFGKLPKPVNFVDTTFTPDRNTLATFRFDSYRLTYRYTLLQKEKLELGLGLTAKVRSASIRMENASFAAEKKNTGFVPLINFKLRYLISDWWSLLLEGDALAAPQGRAEDVFVGVSYEARKSIFLKAGYRILEGGADNDEVYTFSLFHFFAGGIEIRF